MVELTENALTILKTRNYLRKSSNGRLLETPEKMLRRVAGAIAIAGAAYDEEVERDEREFFRMMANSEFLPNSPTLMNAGKNGPAVLPGCFVMPVDDSLESIFKTLHDAALALRAGGGVGFAFSKLRPRGFKVSTTGGVSSGPVSFMGLYDHMAKVINEGSNRRAAMMAILRVDHPDIEEFISAKLNQEKLRNFNVSVGATREFMEALAKGKSYALINPHNNKVVRRVSAQKIFDLICESAWQVADPGMVFLDRINRACPVRHLGEIEATNPCGEQPLLPYQSCNLGHINLAKMVKGEGAPHTPGFSPEGEQSIDWQRLERVVRLGVKFLDNVVDVSSYPIAEIKEMAQKTRKIGLGVMGWADMLFKLGVRYDSSQGVRLAEKVAEFIQQTARDESVRLGKTRGSFPAFRGSRWQKRKFVAIRNSTITTVAPTGTVSIIAGTSSGIEPVFALAFTRKNILKLGKTNMKEVNQVFLEMLEKYLRVKVRSGKGREKKKREILRQVLKTGNCQGIEELPIEMRQVFVTSHEVHWRWHVKMQAAFQKHTDSAVSKTINLPEEATVKSVRQAYLLADRAGCKGITVYRDRSRKAQVLNLPSYAKASTFVKASVDRSADRQGDPSTGQAKPALNSVAGLSCVCPECQAEMVFEESCTACPHCGYSHCSL